MTIKVSEKFFLSASATWHINWPKNSMVSTNESLFDLIRIILHNLERKENNKVFF